MRAVLGQLEPSITSEDIMTLNGDEKYILLVVARVLRMSESAFVDLEDVWEAYEEVCEQYRANPVGRRMFNEFLRSLYNKGMIDVKGLRVGISSVPVEKLSNFLDYVISRLKEEATASGGTMLKDTFKTSHPFLSKLLVYRFYA